MTAERQIVASTMTAVGDIAEPPASDGIGSPQPSGAPGRPTGSGGTSSLRGALAFVVRRVATGILTLLVATVLIFAATNALPGNVAQTVLGHNSTPAAVAHLDKELGLNHSLAYRYVHWLGGVVHGDLGKSAVAVAQSEPITSVASIISTPLRNSLILALIAFVLLLPLSLVLGTLAAVKAGRPRDYVISYLALIFGALPEFVLGTLLIVLFFNVLDLLPPVSLVAPGTSPLASPDKLILPVLTLLGVSVAFCARQVRAGVVASLRQDYVTMARLGGIRERRVLSRYALRNALAPSVQSFAQSLQYLFGGIIIVETLFDYPGVGQALVVAVQARDVTEVAGITFVLAAAYIAINIFADLLVVFLVPKLRTGLR
jgi:peptide/nickel transport system permease protein